MKQQADKQPPVTGKKVAEAQDVTPKGEPLGEYLQKLRHVRGFTMAALAKRAKVNISTIVRMEGGHTSSVRPREAVQQRLAMALTIPVEYLQAATKQEPFSMPLTNKVCATCWVPGTLPDLRWSQIDAKFCMRCGEGLADKCGACSESILLNGRFCPQCGKPYGAAKEGSRSQTRSNTKT
jgi:transcriptional regulator with XRE-family HTH domain